MDFHEKTACVYPAYLRRILKHVAAMMECVRAGPSGFSASVDLTLRRFTPSPV